jgi:hypothetical protein
MAHALHRETEFVVVAVGFTFENRIGERPFQKVKMQVCSNIHSTRLLGSTSFDVSNYIRDHCRRDRALEARDLP